MNVIRVFNMFGGVFGCVVCGVGVPPDQGQNFVTGLAGRLRVSGADRHCTVRVGWRERVFDIVVCDVLLGFSVCCRVGGVGWRLLLLSPYEVNCFDCAATDVLLKCGV